MIKAIRIPFNPGTTSLSALKSGVKPTKIQLSNAFPPCPFDRPIRTNGGAIISAGSSVPAAHISPMLCGF